MVLQNTIGDALEEEGKRLNESLEEEAESEIIGLSPVNLENCVVCVPSVHRLRGRRRITPL